MTLKKSWMILVALAFASLQCSGQHEEEVFGFEITPRDDTVKTCQPPPPAIIYFHLTISNTGTASDSFSVSLKDWIVPAGWTMRLCDAHG